MSIDNSNWRGELRVALWTALLGLIIWAMQDRLNWSERARQIDINTEVLRHTVTQQEISELTRKVDEQHKETMREIEHLTDRIDNLSKMR